MNYYVLTGIVCLSLSIGALIGVICMAILSINRERS